jgi:hypothetical protein
MNNENIDRSARRRMERRFVRHAKALVRAAGRGFVEHRDRCGEESYITACAVRDTATGACMVLTREFGRHGGDIPIPVGQPALHLAIATRNAIPEFALAKLVGECFRDLTAARDVVWSIARTHGAEGSAVLHVFALCDARWKLLGAPSWTRVAPANDPFGSPNLGVAQ